MPLLIILQPVELAISVPVGANSLVALMVSAPEYEISMLGWLVGVPPMVKPTKYKVPLLAMLQPVELAVAVPDDGENLLPDAMVRAPLKEKSPVG